MMDRSSTDSSDSPNRAVLEHHLRRLDRESFAALLRDIYRGRGWDASIEDGLVVATDRLTDQQEVVVPFVAKWPYRYGRVTPARRVDVVATAGDGTGKAGEHAARLNAACRTADEVADSLLYSIDRDVANEICREHFGRAPAAMRPPATRRLRHTLAARSGPAAAAGVLVLLVGLLAVVPNGVVPPDGPSPSTDLETAEPTPRSALSQDGPELPWDGTAGPRRLTAADVSALATAHRKVLVNRTFRRTRRSTGPAAGDTGPVIRQQVKVVGRETFRIRTTASGGSVHNARELYYDGHILYEARFESRSFTYRRLTINERIFDSETPAGTGTIIRQYLTTPNVTMTGPHSIDGGERYRVRARGNPPALDSNTTWNYAAEAVVTPRGLVERLSIAFDRQTDGDGAVSIVVEYETGIGEPAPPRWYQERWGERAPPDVGDSDP